MARCYAYCKDMYRDVFVNLKLLQPGVFPMLSPCGDLLRDRFKL
jgi:hypothetical protein